MMKTLVTGLTFTTTLFVSVSAYAEPPCAARSIAVAQPLDGNTLQVSRIAGAHHGTADTWDMRYDGWFCKPNANSYTVSSVKIEHMTGARSRTRRTSRRSRRRTSAASSRSSS